MAAWLASGWFLFTGLVALFGLVRLLPKGFSRIEESCIDVGLIYFSLGGFWFFLLRLGTGPFGFSKPIVALTAMHFHYISLGALIILGMLGRKLREIQGTTHGLYHIAVLCAMLGPALLAVGITLSQVIGLRLLEVLAALSLATSLILLASLNLRLVVPITNQYVARALLIVSSTSLLLTMLLAGSFALGRIIVAWTVPIPFMIQTHGWINALGFGLCGLLAWRLAPPKSHNLVSEIPFSKFVGRGRIGPDYFQRIGAIALGGKTPRGLVDDMSEYRRPDFAPDEIDPRIRAFYEITDCHELLVYPDWRKGFRLLGHLYKRLSTRVGQMNLPLSAESGEDHIESRILPIQDLLDGRSNVRAWVRTYRHTGRAVYVAAYSSHADDHQRYMNIAFPFPGGNLTSILRLTTFSDSTTEKGLSLTSLPSSGAPGDEGVYFVTRFLPIRLPMNETIKVWPTDAANGAKIITHTVPATTTIVARHDVWVFGLHSLTLYYAIFPSELQTPSKD